MNLGGPAGRERVADGPDRRVVCTWGEYLADDDDPDLGNSLHRHQSTGRPLGQRPFVEHLARLLGRDLMPGKPGRPRKEQKP